MGFNVSWLKEAINRNSAFLMVGYDTFDCQDYPIFCETAGECLQEIENYRNSSDRIIEIYDMSMDLESQISEYRAYHPPVFKPRVQEKSEEKSYFVYYNVGYYEDGHVDLEMFETKEEVIHFINSLEKRTDIVEVNWNSEESVNEAIIVIKGEIIPIKRKVVETFKLDI